MSLHFSDTHSIGRALDWIRYSFIYILLLGFTTCNTQEQRAPTPLEEVQGLTQTEVASLLEGTQSMEYVATLSIVGFELSTQGVGSIVMQAHQDTLKVSVVLEDMSIEELSLVLRPDTYTLTYDLLQLKAAKKIDQSYVLIAGNTVHTVPMLSSKSMGELLSQREYAALLKDFDVNPRSDGLDITFVVTLPKKITSLIPLATSRVTFTIRLTYV